LVNGTDFTVTGAGNTSSSVTITPSASIPTGTNWVLYSDAGNAQSTTLTTAGEFPAKSLEYAFDKLAIGTQEADGKADRALKLPMSDTASTDLPNKTDRASKVLGFDASGNPTAYAQGTSTNSDAVNYDQGGTGSVATTVEAKLQEIVSVKDFGATGDGTTDDSSAIQAASNAAATAGLPLDFPGGTYVIDTEVTLSSNSVWVAKPGTATITKSDGGTHDIISGTSVNDLTIYGLSFDGKRRNGGGVTGISLLLNTCLRVKISNCDFYDGINIFLEEGCEQVIIDGCSFRQGKFGVALGGVNGGTGTSAQVKDVVISNNLFTDTETEAIDSNDDVVRLAITNNVCYGCHTVAETGEEAIDIGGSTHEDILIDGNIIDNNGVSSTGIQVKQNSDRVIVSNNIIRNGQYNFKKS
jgi:hypothetical protein